MSGGQRCGKFGILGGLILTLLFAAASLAALRWSGADEAVYGFLRRHEDWMLWEAFIALPLTLCFALLLMLAARLRSGSGLAGEALNNRLSGILDRQSGQELLDFEIQRAKRYQRPLSLILCDVDRLEEINAGHGRALGDRVVAAVERMLLKHRRSTDLLVRWGGDSFLILCIESDLEAARKTAERLHRLVEKQGAAGLPCPVTASFGVAQLRNEEALIPLLERIDSQLHRAKKNGRNRLAISGAPA